MSKDHAILLLGEAIHIVENWTAYERPLPHALSLLREAKGNLEAAPVRGVDRDPLKSVRILHSMINESLSRNPSLEMLREGCRRLLAELEVREVGETPEATPVPLAVSDALSDALAIDFSLAADTLTARSYVDGQRLLRGWNAMRAALVAALGQR